MNPYTSLPAGFWAVYGIVILLLLVSIWRIFVKMGQPGWKAIIPIYSTWVLIKTLRKPASWFWIIFLGAVLTVGLSVYVQTQSLAQAAAGTYMSGGLIFASLAVFAAAIVLLVYEIMLYHALSKAFGHEAGFTVGLILLSFVFFPILAFGSSRFERKE